MADEPLAADLAGALTGALSDALDSAGGGSGRAEVVRWAARAGVLAGGAVAGVAVRRFAKRRGARRAEAAFAEAPATGPAPADAPAPPADHRAAPLADEPFGGLRCGATPVATDDGIPLWVEACDPPGGGDGRPVLVFVPGFCLTLDSWHFQRRDLGDLGRCVFYDQRGHGRSGRGDRERSTIEQLAHDLRRVIDATAPPERSVVLVGHSLGGMVLMAFAAAYPELFRPDGAGRQRIAGVALLATSPGRLAEVSLGLPAALARLMWPHASEVIGRVASRPAVVERGLRADRHLGLWLTKRLSFGPDGVSADLARFAGAMLSSTPLDVFAEFLPEFGRHDKEAALPTFRSCQTVVVGGEHDLMTPADHSRAIAAVLPAAEVTVLPGTGHLVPLERPDEVNEIIRRLVDRVRLQEEMQVGHRARGGVPCGST